MANHRKGKHIITSSIEHHAVLHPMKKLEERGSQPYFIPYPAPKAE